MNRERDRHTAEELLFFRNLAEAPQWGRKKVKEIKKITELRTVTEI